MKQRTVLGTLILVLVLTGCATAETPSPTPTVAAPPATTEPAAMATATSAPQPTLTPTATPEPAPEPVASFEEAPCPFDVPEGAPVTCGFVVVPEDHSNPDGPRIRLATVIVSDESKDHQPDPVIMLAGGPGERIVANALQVAPTLAPLHPNRDLILFDQRGVGRSEPALECPEFMEAMLDNLNETNPDLATQTLFESLVACQERLVAEGYNLSAYTTDQNAADVNAMRAALGYEEVNLYGGSYGSLLAQAIARDFPEGIRSVAVNSTLPLEKSLFVDASTTVAEAVMHLLDACAADDACNAAYPDLETKLFDAINRLNADPVATTLTNPIDGQSYEAFLTGDAVFANLVTFLYITQIIPVLPQAIDDVYNGDIALMTQLSSSRLALLDLLSRGMMLSVMCNADLVGRTPADLLNSRAALPPELVGSTDPEIVIEYGMFGICENWPVPVAGTAVKEPLVSDIPMLVLEGEFDPVTPPEYGELVASYLSNGHYFELPGVGHDVLGSACAREIAGAFVADPSQAPDATCIAEMAGVAFDVPGAAAELVLEPFVDEERGFSGLVPAGWHELAPANLARGETALDPTYFVLEASNGRADALFADLIGQLGLDPAPEPTATAAVGNFTWDFYTFERPGGNVADLALAEDGGKAYFVYMVATPAEHDTLYEQLFLPAVTAITAL